MYKPSSLDAYMSARSSKIVPHGFSQMLPWTLPSSVHHGFNQVHQNDPFIFPQPPPPPLPPTYDGLFNLKPLEFQFAYEGRSPVHHSRFISDTLSQVVHQPGGVPTNHFLLQADFEKMTAQQIMDAKALAKALAASKSHSEAEKRRREKINNHFNKLRNILNSTTKMDKASLLAEVIQHVKDLKRQKTMIEETCGIPTESDELTVDSETSYEDGKFVIKASLCCEDRADLLPELIKTLKALNLRTLKAEITTLGGRVKNVLFITTHEDESNYNNDGDEDQEQKLQYCINSIQEALRAVMDKLSGDTSASGKVKRQKTNLKILLGHK